MRKRNKRRIKRWLPLTVASILAGSSFAFVFAFFTAHLGEALTQSRQVRDLAAYSKGIEDCKKKKRTGTIPSERTSLEGVALENTPSRHRDST